MDSARVPSITVAVARGGKVVWEEGFGYADIERRIAATPRTLYSMASISKPITATALMQLVEQGKVSLDRPANDYLGVGKITGLAGAASDATVRRVLSHTAGLPLHYRFFYEGSGDARPSMDEVIGRYGVAMFPPGEVYSYANLGYGIIDEIISRASGVPYEEYMRTHVFQPLGMTTTTIGTGAGIANGAVRYDARLAPIPYYDFDHRGASAVYTSAHELLRFGMFHLGDRVPGQRRVLADSTLARMKRVETPRATPSGYGLGWRIDDDYGIIRVQHTGGMPGVATVLSLYPSEDVAVVVLSNQSSPLPFTLAADVAAAVLPPRYAAALAAARAAGRTRTPSALAFPAELLGEWRGTVRTYEGTVPITLDVRSGDVRVRLGDERALWTLLNDASVRDGLLSGRFVGTIPTGDARRYPHVVNMSLQLGKGRLRGWAAAQATTDLINFALSSYAELTRVPASAER